MAEIDTQIVASLRFSILNTNSSFGFEDRAKAQLDFTDDMELNATRPLKTSIVPKSATIDVWPSTSSHAYGGHMTNNVRATPHVACGSIGSVLYALDKRSSSWWTLVRSARRMFTFFV